MHLNKGQVNTRAFFQPAIAFIRGGPATRATRAMALVVAQETH